jgi:DNA-binding LytR/AlgR family response regulator
MNSFSRPRNPNFKKTMKFLVLLVIVLAVAVLQDFLSSRYHEYPFYASESLLFNLFWILIFPIAAGFRWIFLSLSFFQRLKSTLLRNILFVVMATATQLILFSALVHLVSWLFYEHTFSFWRNLNYTVSQDLYKYLLIYGAATLLIFRKSKSQSHSIPSTSFKKNISFSSGKTTLLIPTEDILYLSASSPYVEIHTPDKKHLQSGTLKALLSSLDPSQFVQIHKSTIVNLSFVQSIHSRLNGDYDIVLSNGEKLRLSRNYTESFREKFERHSTS